MTDCAAVLSKAASNDDAMHESSVSSLYPKIYSAWLRRDSSPRGGYQRFRSYSTRIQWFTFRRCETHGMSAAGDIQLLDGIIPMFTCAPPLCTGSKLSRYPSSWSVRGLLLGTARTTLFQDHLALLNSASAISPCWACLHTLQSIVSQMSALTEKPLAWHRVHSGTQKGVCLPPGPTAAAAFISVSLQLLNQQPFRRHHPDASRSPRSKVDGTQSNFIGFEDGEHRGGLGSSSRTSFGTRPCWLARLFPGDGRVKRRHLRSLARMAERNEIIIVRWSEECARAQRGDRAAEGHPSTLPPWCV
jgi:hypothetical protein